MKTSRMLGIVLVMILVVAMVLSGCSSPAPTPTTAPAPAPTATKAPAAATTAAAPATTSGAAGATKTLKVALNINLQWPIGLDAEHIIQADVDNINAQGGLQVGQDKYKVELIIDDNKADQATAKTAAQKEIAQDGVKYIISDLTVDSFLQLADDNKVITVAYPSSPEIYNPKYKYAFQTCGNNTTWFALIPWMAQKYPDKKTFLMAFPDNDEGHPYADTCARAAKGAGLTVLDTIFYPPDSTDLSVVGTKTKAVNPDFFCTMGGGPQGDSMKIKALFQAGWKGTRFIISPAPGETIMGIAGADAVDGLINLAWPAEFDPPSNDLAKQMKDLYKAKYGKWDNPEEVGATEWWTLKAAFAKAGSVDTDKVQAVLATPDFTYQSLGGDTRMVTRPDYKNSRAVDTVMGLPVKQIVGGVAKQIDVMSVDQAYQYCKKIFGW